MNPGEGNSRLVELRAKPRALATRNILAPSIYEKLTKSVAAALHAARDDGRFLMADYYYRREFGRASILGPRLSGGCTIAAAVMTVLVRAHGHRAGPIGGYPKQNGFRHCAHWWVETEDGWILDPTFGQFTVGGEPLVVRSKSKHKAVKGVPLHEVGALQGHPSAPGLYQHDVLDLVAGVGVSRADARRMLGW